VYLSNKYRNSAVSNKKEENQPMAHALLPLPGRCEKSGEIDILNSTAQKSKFFGRRKKSTRQPGLK